PMATPPYVPQIRRYTDWLAQQHGLRFDDYHGLWRWSVADIGGFWKSAEEYFGLTFNSTNEVVLPQNSMPGTQWFPGGTANYARQVMRHAAPAHAAGMPALVARNEKGLASELSWPELQRQV